MGVPHARLAKEHIDLETDLGEEQLTHQLKACFKPKMWAAMPCTSGSPWQRLNVCQYGNKYRKESEAFFERFAVHAGIVMDQQGHATFGRPRDCEGGNVKMLKNSCRFEQEILTFCRCNLSGCVKAFRTGSALASRDSRMQRSEPCFARVLPQDLHRAKHVSRASVKAWLGLPWAL